jgi:hypothetical protein
MKNVTIRRCPVCSNIRIRSEQLKAILDNDPNLDVRVVDGNKGEFTIEVDGHQISGTDNTSLRPVDEIAAEVRGNEVTAAG